MVSGFAVYQSLQFPRSAEIKIEDNSITLHILAENKFPEHHVDFEYSHQPDTVSVKTVINQKL